MARALLVLVLLPVALAVACGDDDEPNTDSPSPSGATSAGYDWSVQYMQLGDARLLLSDLGLEGVSLAPSVYECIQSTCPDEAPGDDSWGCLSLLPTGDPDNAESLYPDDPPGWYSVVWRGTLQEVYSGPPEPVVNEPAASLEPRNDIACGAGYAMQTTAGEAVRFLADNGLEGAWNSQMPPVPTCPAGSVCPIQGIAEDTPGCLSLSILNQPAQTQSGPRPTIYVSWFTGSDPENPDGGQRLYSTTAALADFEEIASSLEAVYCFESPAPTPDPYDSVPYTQILKPAYWSLTELPDGATLELLIAVGNSCDSFERVDVTETEDSVTISAISRQTNGRPNEGCDDILLHHEMTVELDEPLGDRELLGCAPEELWYIDHDVDCAVPGNV